MTTSHPPLFPLKRLAAIRSSNVDKVVENDEIPIRLCNYVDVYNNDQIHPALEFSGGSAKQNEIDRFGLKPGDVLITKDSETPDDIAVPALVVQSADDLVCGYHLALLRPNTSRLSGTFLFYAIKSQLARATFSVFAQGITRFGLTLNGIGSVKVPLPDLPTQKAIADFLGRETARIDQLIEKKQRMVEVLGEKEKAQIARLVVGGLASSVELASTTVEWMPEAPSHWWVRRIATLFRESKEMGEEGLPVLSVSINWGISDRELRDEDRHRIVNQIQDKTAYKRVRPGDLVYNMMRAWQGAFGVATIDGLVSPAYVVARPNEEIHSLYFEPLLRTSMCIEEFRRTSKGIADFRQRLYWEHFRQVRVVLPPLEEQRLIAQKVGKILKMIGEVVEPIEASIDRLREFRSALITAAVTGQIDVSTWGKQGTADGRLDRIEEASSA